MDPVGSACERLDRGLDEIGDRLRLGDVHGVAAGDLAGGGAGALGHLALGGSDRSMGKW
jgi:hypothetical protein